MKRRCLIRFAGIVPVLVLPMVLENGAHAKDSACPLPTSFVQKARSPGLTVCAPAGNFYAVATPCGRIKCRSMLDGTPVRTLHHCHPRAMTFSPDGRLLAVVGTTDGRRTLLKVWNVATGEVICKMHTVDAEVPRLGFSPDSRLLFSEGDGLSINIWHLPEGTLCRSVPITQPFSQLAFSEDGRALEMRSVQGIIERIEVR